MIPPISTRARVAVGLALVSVGIKPDDAVPASKAFFEHLRSRGFDVVHADWVDGPIKADPLSWDTLAEAADAIEESFGRKPWLP